jgi:hypothetical protein
MFRYFRLGREMNPKGKAFKRIYQSKPQFDAQIWHYLSQEVAHKVGLTFKVNR